MGVVSLRTQDALHGGLIDIAATDDDDGWTVIKRQHGA
jgi:hypothetical protein